MKYLKYLDALHYQNPNKILSIIFTSNSCPNCSNFLNEIVKKIEQSNNEDIEFIAVDCDVEEVKFPPARIPTSYFYVPRSDVKIITREGVAPSLDIMKNDISKMIEIKNTGKSFNEVFFSS